MYVCIVTRFSTERLVTMFYEVPIAKLSNVHSPVDLSVRPASVEI